MAPSRNRLSAVESEATPLRETIPVINDQGRTSGVVTDVDTLNTLVDCIATLEDLLQHRLMPAQGAGNRAAVVGQAAATSSDARTPALRSVPQAEVTPAPAGAMKQAVATAVTLASVAPIVRTRAGSPTSSAPHLRAVPNEPMSVPPAVRPPPAPASEMPTAGELNAIEALGTEMELGPPSFVEMPLARAETTGPIRFSTFAPRPLGVLPRSTAKDVQRLFGKFKCPQFAYREVCSYERATRSAAEANIALSEIALPGTDLAHSSSILIEPAPAAAPISRPPRRRSALELPRFAKDPRIPWTVAVVSSRHSVGRTTVAANLSVALAEDSWRSVAVELDPSNDLPRHFGLDTRQRFGIAHETMPLDHLRWQQNGVTCVPFGSTDMSGFTQIQLAMTENERWLEQRLLPLAATDNELWVIDTPAEDEILLRQALSLADVVLAVVTPDVDTSTTIVSTDSFLSDQLEALGKHAPLYVINRFDNRRSLDRLALSAVRGELRERLAPTIHEDVSVQDSLAAGRLVVQAAAQSQVVADFAALADWLNARRTAQAVRKS